MNTTSLESQIQQTHKRLLDVVQGEARLQRVLESIIEREDKRISLELDAAKNRCGSINEEQDAMQKGLMELPDNQFIDLNAYEAASDEDMLRPLTSLSLDIDIDLYEPEYERPRVGGKKKPIKKKGGGGGGGGASVFTWEEYDTPPMELSEAHFEQPRCIEDRIGGLPFSSQVEITFKRLQDFKTEREIMARRLKRLFADQKLAVQEELQRATLAKEEHDKLKRELLGSLPNCQAN